MTMRIPWHLHHSFLQHCVALVPLPSPEDIVLREDVKKNPKAVKGAISAKKSTSLAQDRWAKNRKAKQGKY